MKRIVFLLAFILFEVCSIATATDERMVKPFHFDSKKSHSYSLYTVQSFKGLDNKKYSIRFYVDTIGWSMNDGYYSRIEILKNDKIIEQINNDNTWVKCCFNSSTKEIAKVFLLSEKCSAVL